MNNFFNKTEHIKTAYDKNHQPIFNCKLPIYLFGTGSSGNSVFFKEYNLLIDIGLPFKKYIEKDKNFFSHIDNVILTHHHGDHFNPSTVYKVLQEYPNVNFIITDRMFDEIIADDYKAKYETVKDKNGETIRTFNKNRTMGKPLYKTDSNGNKIIIDSPWKQKFLEYKHRFYIIDTTRHIQSLEVHGRNGMLYMLPCTTKHDNLMNLAITLFDPKSSKYILYASDLDNLGRKNTFMSSRNIFLHVTGLPIEYKFDKMFLEANYDEKILTAWRQMHVDSRSQARLRRSLRHISEREAFEYVRKYLKDDGVFIPLHASSTFGTLLQNT